MAEICIASQEWTCCHLPIEISLCPGCNYRAVGGGQVQRDGEGTVLVSLTPGGQVHSDENRLYVDESVHMKGPQPLCRQY